jgi:hypothetical protein
MRLISMMLLLVFSGAAFARDPAQVRMFRKETPCPATQSIKGACPGYVVDHIYPLCAGGLDVPENMMWQDLKQSYAKDRIERELCKFKKRSCVS